MSGYISGLCYEIKFGCPTTKSVAVALADHASQDGTKVFPSVALIATKCEISPRTVQRALRRLEMMGVLIVVSAGGSGPRDTREWKFDLHLLRTVAASETQQIMHSDKGDTVSPLVDELRVTPVTPKGDTDDSKGDTRVTRTVTNLQEPSTAPLPPANVEPPASGQVKELVLKNGKVRPSIRIRAGEIGWSKWVDHVEAAFGERRRDEMVAAGEIRVATRWPKDDTPPPVIGRIG